MDALDRKIDIWKSRLLDLSKRNKLLFFKPSKYSTVQILLPDLSLLFERLAVSERPLKFPLVVYSSSGQRDLFSEAQAQGEGDEEPASFRVIKGDLETDAEPRDLMRRLYRLRRDTNTAINEQGVHTLFLAIGLLRWRESDSAQEDSFAPILLIPVLVQRESDEKPYMLEPADEDITLNPTLLFKLENDFGVRVPPLPDEVETLDIGAYLQDLASRLQGKGWGVIEEAWLGRFSFEKLVIYADLEAHRDEAKEHQIVAALSGGRWSDDATAWDSSGLKDSVTAPELFPVMDADSSQLETLLRVRSGENLVVYGPPGTGKSQTISNAVAQALRDGKRVLFVSEKMAALEVVERRLREVGLGPGVLEVHSHRANKRAVIEELGKTLFRQRTERVAGVQSDFDSLRELVAQLDEYVSELHRPRDEQGQSAYQIVGKLANLEDTPYLDCPLPMKSALALTSDRQRALEGGLRQLAAVPEVVGESTSHPFRGWAAKDLALEDVNRIRSTLSSLANQLPTLKDTCARVGEVTCAKVPSCIDEAEVAAEFVELLAGAPDLERSWLGLGKAGLRKVRERGSEARQQQESFVETREKLDALSGLGITELPVADLQERFARYGGPFRWLNSSYRKDMADVRKAWRLGLRPDYHAAVRALEVAAAYNECRDWMEEHKGDLTIAFGAELFREFSTDWDKVDAAIEWTKSLVGYCPDGVPGILQAKFVEPEKLRRNAQQAHANLLAALNDVGNGVDALESSYPSLLIDGTVIDEAGFEDVAAWAGSRLGDLPRLMEWARFQRAREACDNLELAQFVDAAFGESFRAEQLVPSFLKRLYTAWLAEAGRQAPAIGAFDGRHRESLVESYRELDRKLLRISAKLTLSRIEQAQPAPTAIASSSSSQMSILLKEVKKKKRHKPLRRLFAEAPQLIQALKPCLLMSPLSVSSYLAKGAFEFDLAVFDEASQIPPWNAICPILRAKQVVVAGDDKQLPPTSFFQVDLDDGDYDEDSAEDQLLESILDECAAVPGFRHSQLKWHYRSRHEGLIAFSNREFYDGELITFPSPDVTDTSVGFIHVPDGVYDRGASRTNRREARRVAELVLEHFENYGPSRSLGVIALSIAQETAIDEELMALRSEHPHLTPFFSEDGDEPFFVKNLENVQGDERDHIIISIGYGRDSNGTLALNFGPINRAGGERRLNVAVTRAKWQAVVVCSFLPHELDLARLTTHNLGVVKLQRYLEYASQGRFVTEAAVIADAPTNEFEDAVQNALERAGLAVDAQVGCSGFRIDLGVRHPDIESRYIVGIECDGAQYHSCRTARDRDRLRQEVLERLGWRLLRIWCPDWLADPKTQVRRVLQTVERLRMEGEKGILAPVATPSRKAEAETEPEESESSGVLQAAVAAALELPEYREYKAPQKKRREVFYNAARSAHALQQLADDVWRIAEVESPIHRLVVTKRLAAIYGMAKAGRQVQEIGTRAISMAERRKLIVVNGDFVWDAQSPDVRPRRRIDGHEPPIAEVAIEEIIATVELILQRHFGMAESDLITETARLLAYDRTGVKVKRRIQEAIQSMRKSQVIHARDGFITLTRDTPVGPI